MTRDGRTPSQVVKYAERAGVTPEEFLARREAGLQRCWRCAEWKDAASFSPAARECRECATAASREQRRQATTQARARAATRRRERDAEREAERRREPVRAAQAERLADALAGLEVDDHPPVAVRVILAQARDLGADFDAAWPVALGRIVDDEDHGGGEGWRNALECTRHAWDAAYAREADRQAAAVGALDLPVLDDTARMAREPAVPP